MVAGMNEPVAATEVEIMACYAAFSAKQQADLAGCVDAFDMLYDAVLAWPADRDVTPLIQRGDELSSGLWAQLHRHNIVPSTHCGHPVSPAVVATALQALSMEAALEVVAFVPGHDAAAVRERLLTMSGETVRAWTADFLDSTASHEARARLIRRQLDEVVAAARGAAEVQ
ncbi:hypothetical protein MUG78_17010 [Gordonia alkaliphila]|uniref:hypothetical protein n=1 Tax=Gordonia alkaliphila TaxID=1053547 RepID=UPI001FF179AB|nr:hypothetical protein [Gordonia alkaliphila]MCK0441101.1 hypothetical protein [Gordonia alkaliphila]